MYRPKKKKEKKKGILRSYWYLHASYLSQHVPLLKAVLCT